MLNWIASLPRAATVLDYGCGKLRYTLPLSKHVRRVHAVDSQIQVSRIQKIGKSYTTISNFARENLDNVRVHALETLAIKEISCDVAILINVLSAIPTHRDRIQAIERCLSLLKRSGKILIVTQHRDHYFTAYAANPSARKHYDGWMISKGENSASFYGIVPKAKLLRYARIVEAEVIDSGTYDKCSYVILSRPE